MSRQRAARVCASIAAAIIATATLLAGCGIPAEDSAREAPPPPGPYGGFASNAPDATEHGSIEETLCLIKDGSLVPVVRKLSEPVSLDQLMQDLLAGPTDQERELGYGTAIPGNNVIGPVTLDQGLATVDIPIRSEGPTRTDEPYAFGQVVCSLTAQPGVSAVSFTSAGEPYPVLRGDGGLSNGPLTTEDYVNIIPPSATPTPTKGS